MEQQAADPYYATIAAVHGITGLIIFAAGILQFALTKGTKLHRVIGRIYFYSWFVILATGAYIGSVVIVAIVVMGFYLSVTAIRAAVLQNKPFAAIDKAIIIIASMIVVFMIFAAVMLTIKQNYTYAILATFFSLLYGWVVIRDIQFYIFHNNKVFKYDYGDMNWYVNHLTRMQFSFITAVGAFTAVQNIFGNTVLNFTLPAMIGFIAVRRSVKYFVKKAGLENKMQTETALKI
jgi:hypothetical protein